MRGFVRRQLAELVKKSPPPIGTDMGARASGPKPAQPQGNRRQRRHQMATLVSVKKQLAKQGVNMEMGGPTSHHTHARETASFSSKPDEELEVDRAVREGRVILGLAPQANPAAHTQKE